MTVYTPRAIHQFSALLLLVLWSLSMPAAAKSGSDVYDSTCLLCHGLVTDQNSWYKFIPGDGSSVDVAVVTPRGPTLSNVVGRPAGIIKNYKYSKGMRKFAETGAVWDRQTLEKLLTNSRSFVKGTFMIMKMGAEDRKLVLDYLENVAPYRP
ncbi:MAG: cytochrome c family protein [Burkholderiaceae bacterium]